MVKNETKKKICARVLEIRMGLSRTSQMQKNVQQTLPTMARIDRAGPYKKRTAGGGSRLFVV